LRGGSRRGQINGSAIELTSNSNSQSRVGHLVPEGVRHTTQRPGVRSPPRSQTWPPLTGQRHSFTLQTRPAKSHGVAHASRTIGCVTVPPSICLPCCSPPSALVAEPPKGLVDAGPASRGAQGPQHPLETPLHISAPHHHDHTRPMAITQILQHRDGRPRLLPAPREVNDSRQDPGGLPSHGLPAI